jgi:putative ABC transport system permease protein
MGTVWQDLRFGARSLARRPGFALVAILTLGLGIGANAAIFSVIDAVLLRPLPFKEPGQLISLWESRRDRGWTQASFTSAAFWDVQEMSRAFDGVAAMDNSTINFTGSDHTDRLLLGRISSNFFQVLGINPISGRLFVPGEDATGSDSRLVLLSHQFWSTRFGRDTAMVGKTILLDGQGYLVVGILPRGEPWLNDADVFVPMTRPATPDRDGFELSVIARMKPGVTLATAKQDVDGIARQLVERYPIEAKGMGIEVEPAERWVASDSLRRALYVLMGAVGFLLLIACVNLANLFLARGTGQSRERALRAALGASRGRIARQVLTESLLVSVTGAAVGLVLALGVIRVLRALAPDGIPRLDVTGINPAVLGFTALATVVTSLLAGLAPALQAGRGNLVDTLRSGERGVTGHHFLGKLRAALVAVEVAASLALLIGAGLLLRSFGQVLNSDRGFETENRVLAEVAFPSSFNGERVTQAIEHVRQRLEAEPGVTSVAALSHRPLRGSAVGMGYGAADKPSPPNNEVPWAGWRVITGGYLKTMGIPLLQGRDFTPQDIIAKPWRVIISRRLAEQQWPGENPVGRTLLLWKGQNDNQAEVIGVAGDTREWGLALDPALTVYLPYYDAGISPVNFVVNTTASTATITSLLRSALGEIDSSLPISQVQTMEEIVNQSVASRRFIMLLLASFAAVALVLALAGVYGVLSYAVSRRTSEIGVRLALGAKQGQVLRLIVSQGMRPVFLGLVIGTGIAFGLTRLMASMLFGVGATDPVTFGGVALLLVGAAIAACWIPAFQATRLDVVKALKEE